jgi:uncharacterized protein YndB with AHSA1/START domain
MPIDNKTDTPVSDRIVKTTVLRAPRERVWRAISDARAFGTWFGLEVDDGAFVAGTTVKVRITATKVDPEIAKKQEAFAGTRFELVITEVTPPHRFAYQWHPYAPPGTDTTDEPMTLVTFELEEVAGGTKLTITESGFDRLPLARRAEAFTSNDGGWTAQLRLVEKYLAREAA